MLGIAPAGEFDALGGIVQGGDGGVQLQAMVVQVAGAQQTARLHGDGPLLRDLPGEGLPVVCQVPGGRVQQGVELALAAQAQGGLDAVTQGQALQVTLDADPAAGLLGIESKRCGFGQAHPPGQLGLHRVGQGETGAGAQVEIEVDGVHGQGADARRVPVRAGGQVDLVDHQGVGVAEAQAQVREVGR